MSALHVLTLVIVHIVIDVFDGPIKHVSRLYA